MNLWIKIQNAPLQGGSIYPVSLRGAECRSNLNNSVAMALEIASLRSQ